MRTIEQKLYTIKELDEKAQQNALNNMDIELFWCDEWMESLKVFCDKYDIELCDWSYDIDGVIIKYNVEYLEHGLGFMVDEKYFEDITNESCPFTGYIGDEALIDPIRKLQETGSKKRIDVLKECLESWKEQFYQDIEHQQTDKYKIEHLEVNEVEFYEDGEVYTGDK